MPMPSRASTSRTLKFKGSGSSSALASSVDGTSVAPSSVPATSSSNQSINKKKPKPAKAPKKPMRPDCKPTPSSSHTNFYQKDIHHVGQYERITRQEFLGFSESISGSSETFHCIHGPEGKQYTEKGLRKRNFIKELDPIPKDLKLEEQCPPAYGWEMAKRLEYLIKDPVGVLQIDRLISHLNDFARISSDGFKIDTLNSVVTVLDYLVENQHKERALADCLVSLLNNISKPILLNASSDVITYFEELRMFLGYLGYLAMRLESDAQMDLVAKGLIYQLSAPDRARGHRAAQLRHIQAAAPALHHTAARMLAVATPFRFPRFMDIAFLLACDTVDNCMAMMWDNIIENIFYRFNPYFPDRPLPGYDINPASLRDINLKLGESSVNISMTCSLLLVLLKATKEYLEENPTMWRHLPCPDDYAQRCFVWGYRYECRVPEHRQQRATLTVVVQALLHVFRDRLMTLSDILMPDVMSLSVRTELPPRADWTATVSFNITEIDANFKKLLIHLTVDFLKIFPYNRFLVESRHWLIGLMYLIDPGLSSLRASWSNSLFAELRQTTFQALLLTVKVMQPEWLMQCGLIRRLLWYIEWYTESPYELFLLYWSMRLLQTCVFPRKHVCRAVAMRSLFNTHGIIIIINLCYTLVQQKLPPVEKSQSILAVSLRLLLSAAEYDGRVKCCVYPNIRWPASVMSLTRKMLDVILYSLDKHFIVSERWLISLMSFIWENIVWKPDFRKMFVADDGIYKLLDLVTVTRYPVQVITLALACDIARAGDAVGYFVTWRANLRADSAFPSTVKRGATIASLLAAVFTKDCEAMGVSICDQGIVQGDEYFLWSNDMKKQLNDPYFVEGKNTSTVYCLAAADMAGSRCSKAYAILHMLSEDLHSKVAVADEAYKLYKDVQLSTYDEAILVLVANYLTIKLNQAWLETRVLCSKLVPADEAILEEFVHISNNWTKDIKRQQEEVLGRNEKLERDTERDLYSFLGRVRVNVALDALREVRCVARSADRDHMAHALLFDAVRAFHRRSTVMQKLQAPVIRTLGPTLDENITGQYVKVVSIPSRKRPKPVELLHPVSQTFPPGK